MNIIIRKAKVVDVQSPNNGLVLDIQIENGVIRKIASNIESVSGYDEIELFNLHVSSGWFDESVSFGEPGYEERETISNGLNVAAKSGFTAVGLQPNTYPVMDNQSAIQLAKVKATGKATTVYPVGALTKKSEGKDMSEMFDMKNAGAVSFGDYKKSIDNPMLLKIALQYAQDIDARVIAFSQDKDIKGTGVAHEGEVSTYLGLKGIPSMAEELQIARNLFLLEYTGGKLHIPTIGSKKSVSLIKEAKKKGLDVTCSVAVHQLVLTDEILREFDTRYKVLPAIGTEGDRKALIDGVLDGTIDTITTDHNPIDIEYKKMDFYGAAYGTIGLESAFGVLQNILPIEVVVDKLTAGKSLFGIEKSTITEGQRANLSLFTPEGEGEFTMEDVLSKSKNSAFLGVTTKGKVYGIYNNNQLVLNK